MSHSSRQQACWLLFLLVAGNYAAVALVAAEAAATHKHAAGADFESQVVQEAVDLSSAHSEEQEMDTKDMESLLHWAIEHSDADALRQKAEEVRKDEAVKDYVERKKRVKELSDIVSQQPTETELMQDNIALLTDDGTSVADKAAALAELQALVEPIDNANDLKVLGGVQPLIALLALDQPPELQAGAAYVLGTAASNNEKLADQLMKEYPELLQLLLKVVSQHQNEEAANKAMYALARLVAGPAPAARTEFHNFGGLHKLQSLVSPSSGASKRVKTRAINLVSDLIELTATGDDTSLETWNDTALAAFAATALDLLQQSEALDAKEKALHAMRTLLMRRGPAGGAALLDEGAEAVLRETLTELDLLAERLEEEAAAAKAAVAEKEAETGSAGAKSSSSSSRSSSSGAELDGTEEQTEHSEAVAGAVDQHHYVAYVGHLCADVLHHLSVHHVEL